MLKISLPLAIVATLAVIATMYVLSVSRQPADMLVVQAASATSAPARAIAWWALERLDSCPEQDFQPTTPIGFVVAGWNSAGGEARFGRALDLLVVRGCNINRYDRRGLTPLHSAILFNNAEAARALLRLGADPDLPSAIDGRDGGRPIELPARAFAEYLDGVSGEDHGAVVAILDEVSDSLNAHNQRSIR